MDLIAAVADETELSRAKAAEVVDAVFGAIEGALKKKEEVRLVGFGTFATAERKASTGPQSAHRRGDGDPGLDHRAVQGRQGPEGRGSVIGQTSSATDCGHRRAVSSAVERLVYTERAGGSNPSPPTRSAIRPQAFAR